MGIISDVHTLFRYGVVPPGWWRPEAVDFTRKFYEYMWNCWSHFVENCPDLEVLVINGDLLHGEDRIDRAINVISADMFEQAAAAVEVLKPIREKCDRLWLLKGTPYHDSKSHEGLEYVAKEIGAEQWSDQRSVGYSLPGQWRNLRFDFAHHQTSGWLYTAGGADRTIMLHLAAVAQNKIPPADVIVRSHLHTRRVVESRGVWAIQTPGWTCVYPWLEKVSERSRSHDKNDVGAIILETDGNRKVFIDTETFNYQAHQQTVRDL